jgi:hypothetical protein
MRFLKSKSTNYPDHGHHGDPPPTRKIPMVVPGIEPGTSWLVVRSSDHQTTRLVKLPHRNPIGTSNFSHTCHMFCHSYSHLLEHLDNVSWEVSSLTSSLCNIFQSPVIFSVLGSDFFNDTYHVQCLQRGVSASPNPQAGGTPLSAVRDLFVQYTRSHPSGGLLLLPQRAAVKCCGDRNPLIMAVCCCFFKFSFLDIFLSLFSYNVTHFVVAAYLLPPV